MAFFPIRSVQIKFIKFKKIKILFTYFKKTKNIYINKSLLIAL